MKKLFRVKKELSTQEEIIKKIKDKKEQLDMANESFEHRLLKNSCEIGMTSGSIGAVTAFISGVEAYMKNVGLEGQREGIIAKYLRDHPDKLEMAKELLKKKDFDSIVDTLNNEMLERKGDVAEAIGLHNLYTDLTWLSVGEGVLIGIAAASLPIIYYYGRKHLHRKGVEKLNKEIKELEQEKSLRSKETVKVKEKELEH